MGSAYFISFVDSKLSRAMYMLRKIIVILFLILKCFFFSLQVLINVFCENYFSRLCRTMGFRSTGITKAEKCHADILHPAQDVKYPHLPP